MKMIVLLLLICLMPGCVATLKADIKASYDPNATVYETEELGTKAK